MELADARVLITGGGTGIGLALAAYLVNAGATVAVNGRRQAPIDAAAKELGVLAVQGDVSVEADATRIVHTVVDAWGGFNTLINNAGFGTFASLLDTKLEDYERVFAADVGGDRDRGLDAGPGDGVVRSSNGVPRGWQGVA